MRKEKKNNYLMREISECPAARVTMLISVRGLGSVEKKCTEYDNKDERAKIVYYCK